MTVDYNSLLGVKGMKFIYVMSKEDAEKMAVLGYALLKKASECDVYIFKNRDSANFSMDDLCDAEIQFVSSDILTF